ncbi:pro-corazonin-like [Athalia rosae]|uniref:pro-corazonin-like n=1 Tax=Athalia rosae TaxID=37344 RepID=UPI0020332158|nr:pro-corazonin-like [Athalia rosae]
MARCTMTLVIFLLSMMTLSLAQTFQYSRGWTNGKRGGHPSQVLGGLQDFGSSSSGVQVPAGNQIADLPTPCQLQKLKMLLRGTAATDQLYLVPCEVLSQSGAAPSIPEFASVGRFRRSTNLEDNDNGY